MFGQIILEGWIAIFNIPRIYTKHLSLLLANNLFLEGVNILYTIKDSILYFKCNKGNANIFILKIFF